MLWGVLCLGLVAVAGGDATSHSPQRHLLTQAGCSLGDCPLRVLQTTAGFALQGSPASQNGFSVSHAGDVNHDGIDDFVIGAPGGDQVHVVFGSHLAFRSGVSGVSSFMDGVRGFTLNGEVRGDLFGYAVSGAGDINKDGIDDLVVGAPLAQSIAGKVYVIFGSKTQGAWGTGSVAVNSLMDGVKGFSIQGNTGDGMGVSVSGGDLNGDGIADLFVGAPALTALSAGRVIVVFGSSTTNAWGSGVLAVSSLTGLLGFVLQGAITGDDLGRSVSPAGDVNHDGINDLITSARLSDQGSSSDVGKVYVIFGTNVPGSWGSGLVAVESLMNGIRGFSLQGVFANDHFGLSVSGLGDVNGDGIHDVIVGAPYVDGDSSRFDFGAAYIVFGALSRPPTSMITDLMDGVRGFRVKGLAVDDDLGFSVSRAGDVNNDGIADVLIGSPYSAGGGKSYVIYGDAISTWNSGEFLLSSLDGSNGFRLLGEGRDDQSGRSVSVAGDVNGDGLVDFLIGAPGFASVGKTYVVLNSVTNSPTRAPTSPTRNPSKAPSSTPTRPSRPTKAPAVRPTRKPSKLPTSRPTRIPSRFPTRRPTRTPTTRPTARTSVACGLFLRCYDCTKANCQWLQSRDNARMGCSAACPNPVFSDECRKLTARCPETQDTARPG